MKEIFSFVVTWIFFVSFVIFIASIIVMGINFVASLFTNVVSLYEFAIPVTMSSFFITVVSLMILSFLKD